MVRFQILHFSDLHLHVDANGKKRPGHERSALIKLIQTVGRRLGIARNIALDLMPHSIRAFRAFEATLDGLFRNDDFRPIVVQSGDVEAYGIIDGAFSGHDFLDQRRKPWIARAGHWIDVFGNHDIWPGTIPALGQANAAWVEWEIRKRPVYSGVLPDVAIGTLPATPPIRLEIYRLTSICRDPVQNLLAQGRLNPDILLGTKDYPRSSGRDPVEELRAIAREQASQRPDDEKALRLVVLHHPPCILKQPADLLARLSDPQLKFHLCMAGHTHLLDPAPQGGFGQAAGTIPLVTGTATKTATVRQEPPCFCVYSIAIDEGTIAVGRRVFTFTTRLGSTFSPQPDEVLGYGRL